MSAAAGVQSHTEAMAPLLRQRMPAMGLTLFLPTRQVLHWTTYFLKNGVQQLSMYVFYSLVGVSEVLPNQQLRVYIIKMSFANGSSE